MKALYLICFLFPFVLIFYSHYGASNNQKSLVLQTTRRLVTGDKNKRVRDHLLDLMEGKDKQLLKEHKIKAFHYLRRRGSSMQKRNSLSILASAPRRVSEALRIRSEYSRRDRGNQGDGINRIHSLVKIPSAIQDESVQPIYESDTKLTNDGFLLYSILVKHNIFKIIDSEFLSEFCSKAERINLPPDQVLFTFHEEYDLPSFDVVVDGSVDLYTGTGDFWHSIRKEKLLYSLMELVMVLLGMPVITCVTAKTNKSTGCTILRVPSESVTRLRSDIINQSMVKSRVIFIALMRLNTVTLMTAIRYLGLTKEIGNHSHLDDLKAISGTTEIFMDMEELRLKAIQYAINLLCIEERSLPPIEIDSTTIEEKRRDSLLLGDAAQRRDEMLGLRICYLKEGRTIMNLSKAPALYIVVSGCLMVTSNASSDPQTSNDSQTTRRSMSPERHPFRDNTSSTLYIAREGDAIGQLSVLTSSWEDWYGNIMAELPICNVTATCDSFLLRIPQKVHDRLVGENPEILCSLAKRIISRQSILIRQLDIATDWVHLSAGDILVQEGDTCDSLHVVLNGRLRRVVNMANEEHVVGELSRGNTVGETEILTHGKYKAIVQASRESQLCRIPGTVFHNIAYRFPDVLIHFSRAISLKYFRQEKVSVSITNKIHRPIRIINSKKNQSTAIAILPISDSAPLSLFSQSLYKCLRTVCSVQLLASEFLEKKFSVPIGEYTDLDHVSDIGCISWINQQEERNSIVLYQCDWDSSGWTRLCIRQADLILLVGNAADTNFYTKLESEVRAEKTNASFELVLLHVNPHEGYEPSDTKKWIEHRPVNFHHHVRLYTNAQTSLDCIHYRSDISRLARWLTGTSIGLVLGGGGARGTAHLGILRALEEEGIPIDLVGGTSIGSFYGGLYAMSEDSLSIRRTAKMFSREMGSIWGYIRDITLPWISYFSGSSFNLNLFSVFKNRKIEDMWLSYFCVTTDLVDSKEVVHQNGTMWRYIRASMSLCGYLPPLCDAKQDHSDEKEPKIVHYLCDGGYVNNLPADIMKLSYGAGIIIAVDVSGDWTLKGEDYGESISGLQLLWRKWNPFLRNPSIPSLTDIQSQLAYISSVKQLDDAKAKYIDLYLRPPVTEYQTLDFQKFSDIEKLGYEYGKSVIKEWKAKLLATQDYRGKILEWTRERNIPRSISFGR